MRFHSESEILRVYGLKCLCAANCARPGLRGTPREIREGVERSERLIFARTLPQAEALAQKVILATPYSSRETKSSIRPRFSMPFSLGRQRTQVFTGCWILGLSFTLPLPSSRFSLLSF